MNNTMLSKEEMTYKLIEEIEKIAWDMNEPTLQYAIQYHRTSNKTWEYIMTQTCIILAKQLENSRKQYTKLSMLQSPAPIVIPKQDVGTFSE